MFLWGTSEFEALEGAREEYKMLARDPNYTGMEFQKSEITGKMEAVEKTPWMRYLRPIRRLTPSQSDSGATSDVRIIRTGTCESPARSV
jgi:hypothetical protein